MEEKVRRIRTKFDRPLTLHEIADCRDDLAKLNLRDRAENKAVWQYYDPSKEPGKSIYNSFRDKELLELLLSVMPEGKKTAHWERLNAVYAAYISVRFGSKQNAIEKALSYRHYAKLAQKWAPGWEARVCPDRLIAWGQKRGVEITDKMLETMEAICARAVSEHEPPVVTKSERSVLHKLSSDSNVLFSYMNIPALSKAELRFLRHYWQELNSINWFWGQPADEAE